jgi:hypothetical protein
MKLTKGAMFCMFVVIAGCGKTADRPVVTRTSEGQSAAAPADSKDTAQSPALVRFVNAEPTIDRADLWFGDQPAFSAVTYRAVTPYKELPGDRRDFRLRGAGASTDLAANQEGLRGGRRYTIVAMRKADNSSMLAVFSESARPQSGAAGVRLINAAAGMGALDVGIAGRNDRIANGVKFGEATDYHTVQTGPTVLEVRRKEKKTGGVPVQSRNLEAGKLYTLIALGDGQQDLLFIEDEFSNNL